MSLLALPTEVLEQILQELGSRYLRSSADNLLVCKKWYQTIWNFAFSLEELEAYTVARQGSDEFRVRTDPSMRSLEICIIEADSDHPLHVPNPIPGKYKQVMNPLRNTPAFRIQAYCFLRFNANQIRLRAPRVFVLRLAFEELDTSLYYETQRMLTLSHLVKALPASLTSITLDSAGEPASEFEFRDHHICPLFMSRTRFPRLKKLALRLARICTQVFHDDVADYPPLQSLVLNLTISLHRDMTRSFVRGCRSGPDAGFNIKGHLEEAGRNALVHLPHLKTFHIVEGISEPYKGKCTRWRSYVMDEDSTLLDKVFEEDNEPRWEA